MATPASLYYVILTRHSGEIRFFGYEDPQWREMNTGNTSKFIITDTPHASEVLFVKLDEIVSTRVQEYKESYTHLGVTGR